MEDDGGNAWSLDPKAPADGQRTDEKRFANPVRVGGRAARFLKRVRPNRTFLEVDEFQALLDAAGELEAEARTDFKGLGRRAMVATLGLAGLRISEMIDLLPRKSPMCAAGSAA